MSKPIGLDFGTTNSALAYADSAGSVQLAEFRGAPTFRSILYFEEDDSSRSRKIRVIAGPDAIESYLNAKSPGRLIQSTKSYLASRLFTQTQIFSAAYSLEDLIAILLRYLRQSAEEQLGPLGSSLVVGRPVHFSGAESEQDDQFALSRLRSALATAGFDQVHFLPEPVAAAYRYQRTLDHDELVLIADFGGGTSDFSLVRLSQNKTGGAEFDKQVIGNDGVGIAGDSFDSKIVRRLVAPALGFGSQYKSQFGKVLPVPNWFYEHLERWHYLSFLKTRKNMALLKQMRFQALEPDKISALIDVVDHDLGYSLHQSTEAAKCALSEQMNAWFRFSAAAVQIDREVARSAFESWIETELHQIALCVDRLLAVCNISAVDVDAVFMTGGSSFVPAVRRIFEQKFTHAAIRSGREFTSVAEGLALHALERM